MADGAVIIEIQGDDSNLQKSLSGVQNAFGKIKSAIAAIGVGAAVKQVASIGMDFESSMSQVAATMGITVDEINNGSESFEMLRQAAKDAGNSTKYSAGESAEALNYLALAGYDAEKACSALPSVLNLAAAGSMDLAYASDLVTDSMSALGIEATAENLQEFGDQLAKASTKANTSVAQLGEAILTVGGTAKSLAGGTIELNTALGILADNGIKGSEGGTALRNVILSLSAPTDQAAAALNQLGVEVFDAEGNMRPLNETFKDLNATMADMTDADKKNFISTIFNKTDIKSVEALMANCGDRFDELSASIEDSSGAMQNMADTQMANLSGQLELLKSAASGFAIELYESVSDKLSGFVGLATEAVNALTTGFQQGGLSGLAAAGAEIVSNLVTPITAQLPQLAAQGATMLSGLADGIRTNLPQMIPVALEMLTNLTASLRDSAGTLISAGLDVVLSIGQGIIASLPSLISYIPQIVINIAGIINDNAPKLVMTAINLIGQLAIGLIRAIPTLIANIPKIIQAIVSVFTAFSWGALGKNLITGIKNGISAAKSVLPKVMNQARTAIVNTIKNLPGTLMSLGKSAISMLGSGIRGAIGVVRSAMSSVASGLFNVVSSLPSRFISIGKNIIAGIGQGIRNATGSLLGILKNALNGLVGKALSILGIHSPSKVFEKKVGRWIPPGIGVGVKKAMPQLKKDLAAQLSGLTGTVKTTVNAQAESYGNRYATMRQKRAENDTGSVTNVTINQTNNSPKALSQRDIYRQTKRAAREVAAHA